MKDNSVNKNNSLAGWIDDFINSFAKVKEAKDISTEKEKTAEINISDLSEIVWNDESFYVYFDESGATIFNIFGNEVTTLDGVNTMDEVNDKLNSRQVVSSVNDEKVETAEIEEELEIDPVMETEINKALNYIDEHSNDEESIDENSLDNEEQVEVSVDETIETPVEDSVLEEGIGNILDIDKIVDTRLTEMEEKLMTSFEAKMEELMGKMYARVSPSQIENLDLNVEEEEVEKFEKESVETEKHIEEENNIDRTTPEGKYSVTEESTEEAIEEITEEPIEFVEESEEVEEPTVIELEEVETEDQIDENTSNEYFDEELEIIGDDAEIFKEAKCPCCSGKLFKTAELSDSVEITCDEEDCKTEYIIDINTGKIYIK